MSASRRARAAFALAAVLAAAPATVRAADVSWRGWTFGFEIGSNYTGLALTNVSFQERLLIAKINFPVMRVFYADDECGPYADRLGGTLLPIPWANGATVAQREFTHNGQQWYEIGIRDLIGAYDMYQVYYLSADGILDAHIYAKGLQCEVNHVHYPNWRIDFELELDVEDDDQVLRNPGTGFVVLPAEFDALASTAANHAWRARDASTGLYVDVLPGFSDFTVPDSSSQSPVVGYAEHTVFGRRYQAIEDGGWTYGPNTQVPFNTGENIDSQDIVLWYEGFLPHTAAEGGELWHSTGIRLVSSLTVPSPDSDGDLVADATDNCTLVANADQRDTNTDGYGNLCDADLDNTGGLINFADLAVFRAAFGSVNEDADLDGSGGVVNFADLAIFRSLFGKEPGPAALP
jgi:hypothetical protein